MPYSDEQLRKHDELMARGEALPLVVSAYGDKHAEGSLRVLHLSPEERSARARKFLLSCIGLGCVSVVCPPHLLWPVVLFSVGGFGYFSRLKRGEVILGGEARCAHCGAVQLIDGANFDFPFPLFCTECQKRSSVARAPSA